MDKKVGDRIKDLRQKKGMTQAELAESMGFTSQTVSNWESGAREPDISALANLASLFGVTLDYLLLGKSEEDKITLDDMDAEKRLSWIIKRDDVENFKKYSYVTSAYIFGRTQNMNNAFRHGCNYNIDLVAVNVPTWKEMISSGAKKILNLCLDEFLNKNNVKGYWLAFCVFDFMDEFVKAAVDLDRDDVLAALGIQFFAINGSSRMASIEKTNPMLIGPSNNLNDKRAYAIEKETFEYFFKKESSSPRCFKLITTIAFQEITAQTRQCKQDRKDYVMTFMERELISAAVQNKKYDLVKTYMEQFKAEAEHVNQLIEEVRANRRGDVYYLNESFVTNSQSYDGPRIYGRLFKYESNLVDTLINDGQLELAKEMIKQNKVVAKYIVDFFRSTPRDHGGVYILTDNEFDRKVKLNRSDISDSEKTLLECVDELIIKRDALASRRDLKLAREILDKYYLTYYEFAYKSIVNNDVKELYKFLIDNELNDQALTLLHGPEVYERFLRECWNLFRVDRNTVEYREHESLFNKQVLIDYPKRDEHNFPFDLEKEASKLTDNRIIKIIQEKKDAIYKGIEDDIAARKKAKEEAEERAKIVKGLTREYFEELLSKKETELFIIKLCAYFDAILRFDYHFDGEDFSARMNQYFAQLDSCAPQSRDKDDGWGYMVLDEEYENNVVIPERNRISHLRDLFNRLRIQRNNIAHSESKKVNELSESELKECLDNIMPKKEAK